MGFTRHLSDFLDAMQPDRARRRQQHLVFIQREEDRRKARAEQAKREEEVREIHKRLVEREMHAMALEAKEEGGSIPGSPFAGSLQRTASDIKSMSNMQLAENVQSLGNPWWSDMSGLTLAPWLPRCNGLFGRLGL